MIQLMRTQDIEKNMRSGYSYLRLTSNFAIYYDFFLHLNPNFYFYLRDFFLFIWIGCFSSLFPLLVVDKINKKTRLLDRLF